MIDGIDQGLVDRADVIGAHFQTDGATLILADVFICFIYCFDHLKCLCNTFYGLSALVDCWSSTFVRRIIYKFLNICPFDYTAFAVRGKTGIP